MPHTRLLILPAVAMCLAVTASNIFVQYPLNWFGLGAILTYGAFTYPFAFLINDLTNRQFGASAARRVVLLGFVSALIVSWEVASPRLAIASGLAFLCSQLLDIFVFNPLRQKAWWKAPLTAGLCGALLDSIMFFYIAFSAHFAFIDGLAGCADGSLLGSAQLFHVSAPLWLSLGVGDFLVKVLMVILSLLPYRGIILILRPSLHNLTK